MKILVIEDEPALLEILQTSLEMENFLVETATDFGSAMKKIALYDYDCILLDIMLPGGSGMDVLKEIKALGKQDGVIIISAKNAVGDKIDGLQLGADDYLTKPFHMAELNARIHSVLRRKTFKGQEELKIGQLVVHPSDRKAQAAGEELPLNRKEFDILLYFVVNKNRLVSRSSLAEHVWGDHFDDAGNYDFIYSQIKNLRKKLKDAKTGVEIQAVYGIGYKIQEEE